MILFFLIIAVVIIFWFYKRTVPELLGWRKYLLILLRIVSISIVLILLFNPVIYFIKNLTQNPEAIILEDCSESMLQKNDRLSKTEALKEFKIAIEKKLISQKYKIHKFDFADGLNGNSGSTNLSRTILQLAKQVDLSNVKSIFLFSDGWFKDDNLKNVEELYIPVYTFNPDFSVTDFDIKVQNLKYNRTVYQQEQTPIMVNVSAKGFSGKARLKLTANKKLIQTHVIDFASKDFDRITFETSFEKTGLQPFEVTISSDSTNEVNKANNVISGAIQVFRERSKILLISDRLNWDIKFMIDAIKQNPHWEHDFLLKNSELMKGRKKVFLKDEIEQVIVLFLDNNGSLRLSNSEIDIIKRFVRNGGGLIYWGKPLDSLSDILPASASKIRTSFQSTLNFTEESKKYQTFNLIMGNTAENIPPVDYNYIKPKMQSKVLAELENEEHSAAIIFCNIEKGRILQFAFHNLWKWQLWDADDHYNKFIKNITSWLSSATSERFISKTDKNSYFAGEKIKIILNAYDEKLYPILDLNAKITVLDEKQKKVFQEFLLKDRDEYSCEIEKLDPGKYSYKILDEQTGMQTDGEFLITLESPESRDSGFNIPLLSYISMQTEGVVLNVKELENFEIGKAEIIKKELKTEFPIYRKWFVIFIFLVCFCLELFLRKRWGL
ncbi:MAG: hypothetical protein K8R54_03375, partial [Bacteroidales bacterium]|nr:hypothetical protein [Bacteroidales bacterium]